MRPNGHTYMVQAIREFLAVVATNALKHGHSSTVSANPHPRYLRNALSYTSHSIRTRGALRPSTMARKILSLVFQRRETSCVTLRKEHKGVKILVEGITSRGLESVSVASQGLCFVSAKSQGLCIMCILERHNQTYLTHR